MPETLNTTKDFAAGDVVRYVPRHADDHTHPDCEDGVVTSTNDRWVFVRYWGSESSKATDPNDLIARHA